MESFTSLRIASVLFLMTNNGADGLQAASLPSDSMEPYEITEIFMSNQPNNPSNIQKPGTQQSGDTNKTPQQQVGGSAGIKEGDAKRPGGQAPAAPAKQPGGMPNPI
jgi:hypothetical protein